MIMGMITFLMDLLEKVINHGESVFSPTTTDNKSAIPFWFWWYSILSEDNKNEQKENNYERYGFKRSDIIDILGVDFSYGKWERKTISRISHCDTR